VLVFRASRLLLALSVASHLCACAGAPPADVLTPLTIATGGTGGVYYPLGDGLAQIYNSKIHGLHATAEATVASVFNVEAIQRGEADMAFTQGDVAYVAFKRGTSANHQPHEKLRGVAVLYVNVVQIVTSLNSHMNSVSDFRGGRIGVGAAESGTEVAARIIIEAHGLKYTDVQPEFLSFSEVAERLEKGSLDAGFVVASYPVAAIIDASRTVAIRLIPIDHDVVDRIRADYPFLKPAVVPRGTYRDQTEDIETVGVDTLLVCRDDLPEELVYQLTKTLFEALPDLALKHSAASLIDPDQAPATPIPLHPGAARYYRERELLK
jgi:TRAP transporter TAXI family solute receptor